MKFALTTAIATLELIGHYSGASVYFAKAHDLYHIYDDFRLFGSCNVYSTGEIVCFKRFKCWMHQCNMIVLHFIVGRFEYMHRFGKMMAKRTCRRGDYKYFDLLEKVIIREAFMWRILVNQVTIIIQVSGPVIVSDILTQSVIIAE